MSKGRGVIRWTARIATSGGLMIGVAMMPARGPKLLTVNVPP